MQILNTKGFCPEGFLLLDHGMNPVLVDPSAAQILAYPRKIEPQEKLDSYLTARVWETLINASASSPTVVSRFQSGRRTYSCRSFTVTSLSSGHPQTAVAVVLERASTAHTGHVFERFKLTTREQEVAQLLLEGLTSKEIGARMQISPNTVKAFLRLIMMKMGVSTRSGIVGKAFTLSI